MEVYRGFKQILGPLEKPIYKIKLPNTQYRVGVRLSENAEIKKIKNYQGVLDLGFILIATKVTDSTRWRPHQVVAYELVRKDEAPEVGVRSNFPVGKFPHYAEHDPVNKVIRLIGANAGPNGYGPWIYLDKGREPQYNNGVGVERTYKGYSRESDEIISDTVKRWIGVEDVPEPIRIHECAFMITNANEIICFDDTIDMPALIICGTRGSGKSYCLHSLCDRFFWKPKFRYKLALLNDSSRETGTWCLPNDDPSAIKILKRLNEKPLPLPCVYFHPIVKEDYEKLHMGTVGFDVTLPFKQIVDNHEEYLDLGNSRRYFNQIQDQLAKCTNQAEAEGVLDLMQIKGTMPANSANKIREEMHTLFSTRMTDISSKQQEPWTTSKNMNARYNPLTASLHAGLFPVLVTEYISNVNKRLSLYFSHFAGDLFNRQKQDVDFVKESSRLALVVDEAHNIAKKGASPSPADELMRRCVKEGRPRRIGVLLATQKFKLLPEEIKDVSTHVICFKNPGEAATIANQFSMGSDATRMIKELGKHECLAYTTEHFVVYDSNGERRKSNPNEIFIGKTLPPYSLHKKPQRKG